MTFEEVTNRLIELKKEKKPSKRDIEDLLLLANLDIYPSSCRFLREKTVLRFQPYLSVEEQIFVSEQWFRNRRYRKAAIMFIFRNYNKIIRGSQYLNEQIRLFSGNHSFKRERKNTRVICFQLIYHFDSIDPNSRRILIELLVRGMNSTTGMAARKLFGRKFNLLPVTQRNKILREILKNKKLPDYFVRSFLNEKYEQVDPSNIELITRKLIKKRLLDLDLDESSTT